MRPASSSPASGGRCVALALLSPSCCGCRRLTVALHPVCHALRTPQYLTFADLTLSILSTISSMGPAGISGVSLSRQYNLAPKDTFYHTKRLVSEELVCVCSISLCYIALVPADLSDARLPSSSIKMGSTEGGAHTIHFTHHRFAARSESSATKPSAEQPQLHRRFLNNYEILEPKAMAVFEAQPKGVLRTLQLWGTDGFLLRQMVRLLCTSTSARAPALTLARPVSPHQGYRGRIDSTVGRTVKRLIRALMASGKIRRINVRNTTAKYAKGLIAAYQAMSRVDSRDASTVDIEVSVAELGLDDGQAGDLKPLIGDEGADGDGMAVVQCSLSSPALSC